MGIHNNIGIDRFPKQSDLVGTRVEVFFYDVKWKMQGVIVRDDMESPYRMIIKLDDGRHVLADECMYSNL